MDSKLLNAAIEGSVELLRQDKLVLQRYMAERLNQTPLHIAAMKGHLEFTKEVLENMPEMCFAKDCEGRNPLHMAVIKGHIDILKELLKFRPQAAKVLLGASTILHLCVKHHQLEALKCILEVFPDDAEYVNSKDEEGSSILHLAVAGKQTEVVKFLLQEHGKVDVNARNAYGLTAWDISLALGRRDIKDIEVAECLQQARELGSTSTIRSRFLSEDTIPNDSSANVSEPKCYGTGSVNKFTNLCFKTAKEDPREKKKRLEESCNALMIAASIISTVTFQALIQRPEKFKDVQKPDQCNNTQPPDKNFDRELLCIEHELYMLFNTLSFSATVCVLLLLISGLPLKHRILIWILRITMWIAVLSAAIVIFIVDSDFWGNQHVPVDAASVVGYAMMILIVILTVGHVIRVLFKMVGCLRRRMKARKGRAKSNAQDQSRV